MHRTLIIFITTILLFVVASCANKGGDSITATMPTDSEATSTSTRQVIGIWSAEIDPDAKTFTVTPDIREGSFHFPLTQQYPNVLKVTDYGWAPNFWADVKLKHPYPGTGIKAYDPRVITILPANLGVSFNYPVLNVNANNSVVLEPDGYTKCFDEFGGAIFGNANPFKAYFKDQPYRVWSGMGVTEETQQWQMKLTGFGGPMRFRIVVDISTNYPDPPHPVVDNAPEPVKIDAAIGDGLSQCGGSADISVTLLDWQGRTNIGGVRVEAPKLFSGTVNLTYSADGPNPNEYVYAGIITNSLFSPEGEYEILIATWDQITSIYMYNEFTVFVRYVADGNLIWAKSAGGIGSESGRGVITLSDDSMVVTGYFWDVATFGQGEPNETVLTSAGWSDIFIVQYNPDGTLVWAKSAGGTSGDSGQAMTSLSDDSTVVTGYYANLATFGQGEPNETVLTSGGIFIARYNPNGTLAWAKHVIGETPFGYSYAITTLSDNSTVVTGSYTGTVTFGEGEINQTILTSCSDEYSDIFIARYNPDGTLVWAKSAGGPYPRGDVGRGVTTLSDDSTVVTGHYSEGGVTFGLGEINETFLFNDQDPNAFIARYNPDGTLAWAKNTGGAGGLGIQTGGYDVTTLSDDSMVVTGWSSVGGGGNQCSIFCHDADGMLAWSNSAGGQGSVFGVGITTLSDNSTVVAGGFSGTVTFGSGGPNEILLIPADGYGDDAFIAKYNPDGTFAWVRCAGGYEGQGSAIGVRITTLSDNSTVVAGGFSGTVRFGRNEINELFLTSAGQSDIFIARFEP